LGGGGNNGYSSEYYVVVAAMNSGEVINSSGFLMGQTRSEGFHKTLFRSNDNRFTLLG